MMKIKKSQPPSVPKPSSVPVAQSAIDLTAEFLHPLLSPEKVANLVLISMVYLPDVMPASIQATYTPVESAGTYAQIKHLARLMANRMTAAGIGPDIQLEKLTNIDVKHILLSEKATAQNGMAHAAPARRKETADKILQVDLPVVEENPTPDPVETVGANGGGTYRTFRCH
ncbi:hypothetical protein J4Q44_G00122040 [Coregonus suidteri]|uniref:Uncharacterized protein n=1 Tax=Coregonus suidteri TaxID=861788 RepID=A0AAN8QUX7_9TELE